MKKILFATLAITLLFFDGESQRRRGNTKAATTTYTSSLYEGMTWRLVGPFRGGRSATVTGVPGKANLYYMGATGGGVWRDKRCW